MEMQPRERALLDAVPSFCRFLTLWELDRLIRRLAARPGVTAHTIGRTVMDEPIAMLEVGTGPRTGVIVGVPHSDEPLGSLVALHLLRWLTDHPEADAFGWRWLIVPVLERSGMRLNEGWFNNLDSFDAMAKTYFREPVEDQYEWSFPIAYEDYEWHRSRPETLAVKTLLERERPTLLFGLHHSGFLDAYYYFSDELGAVYSPLRALAERLRIPLSAHAPDVPFGVAFAPGFYRMYGSRDYIDYYKEEDPAALRLLKRGACSDEWYQNEIGGFSFNCEVPMYRSPKLADLRSSGRPWRSVLGARIERQRQMAAYTAQLLSMLEPYEAYADPVLYRVARKHVANAKSALEVEERGLQRAKERVATRAERFENGTLSDLFDLFFLGQVWRVAESVCLMGGPKSVCRLMDQTDLEIRTRAKHIRDRGGFYQIPIRSAIALQLGSLLIIARALGEKERDKSA